MVFDIVNDVFGEPYTEDADPKAVLAANVRRARVARRLSLSELARGTGLGKATLSQIERGAANPTVETLRLLAEALQLPVGELLEDPHADDVRVVRRPRPAASAPARRSLDRFTAGSPVEAVELNLAAGHHEEVAPGPPGARDELFVVQGTLVAGPVERPTELGPGDWASFPADVPRRLSAGRSPVRALLLAHA